MKDPIRRFGGVDWVTDCDAVVVVDEAAVVVDDLEIAHTIAGSTELCGRLAKSHVGRTAIERPDGPVVEALLDGGF